MSEHSTFSPPRISSNSVRRWSGRRTHLHPCPAYHATARVHIPHDSRDASRVLPKLLSIAQTTFKNIYTAVSPHASYIWGVFVHISAHPHGHPPALTHLLTSVCQRAEDCPTLSWSFDFKHRARAGGAGGWSTTSRILRGWAPCLAMGAHAPP